MFLMEGNIFRVINIFSVGVQLLSFPTISLVSGNVLLALFPSWAYLELDVLANKQKIISHIVIYCIYFIECMKT